MSADGASPIVVLAAVVERDGRFLVTRRLTGTHLAGPVGVSRRQMRAGGNARGLPRARAAWKSSASRATIGDEILVTEHAYPERTVRLHFRRCEIAGEPEARLGQQMRWVAREALGTLDFPAADRALIDRLVTSPAPRPR